MRGYPWEAQADALEATEGDYADYAGWEVWMALRRHGDVLENLDTIDRVPLYGLCCQLWKGEV